MASWSDVDPGPARRPYADARLPRWQCPVPCTPCRCDLKHRDRRRRQSTTSRLRPNSRERVGPARRRRRHRTSWTVPTTSSACVTARATRCVEFTRTAPPRGRRRRHSWSALRSEHASPAASFWFLLFQLQARRRRRRVVSTSRATHRDGRQPGARAGDVQVQPTSSGQRTSAGRLHHVARHTESTLFLFLFLGDNTESSAKELKLRK